MLSGDGLVGGNPTMNPINDTPRLRTIGEERRGGAGQLLHLLLVFLNLLFLGTVTYFFASVETFSGSCFIFFLYQILG